MHCETMIPTRVVRCVQVSLVDYGETDVRLPACTADLCHPGSSVECRYTDRCVASQHAEHPSCVGGISAMRVDGGRVRAGVTACSRGDSRCTRCSCSRLLASGPMGARASGLAAHNFDKCKRQPERARSASKPRRSACQRRTGVHRSIPPLVWGSLTQRRVLQGSHAGRCAAPPPGASMQKFAWASSRSGMVHVLGTRCFAGFVERLSPSRPMQDEWVTTGQQSVSKFGVQGSGVRRGFALPAPASSARTSSLSVPRRSGLRKPASSPIADPQQRLCARALVGGRPALSGVSAGAADTALWRSL